MKKIKSAKELPKWFSLDSYTFLESIDLKYILNQIKARQFWINAMDDLLPTLREIEKKSNEGISFENLISEIKMQFEPDASNLTPKINFKLTINQINYTLCRNWASIVSGNPDIKSLTQVEADTDLFLSFYNRHDFYSLFGTSEFGAIRGLTIGEINACHKLATGLFIDERKIWESEGNNSSMNEIIDFNKARENPSEIYCSVNIKNFTDKELHEAFAKSITEWRANSGIYAREDILLSKPSHRQKILDYKLIPYLDLKNCEYILGLKIPHSVMASMLFPYGEKGELEFRQSILPFYKKIIDTDYRNMEEFCR
jgi:hypothetical protein